MLPILLLEISAARSHAQPNGEELYRSQCARCHGWEGHGDGPDAAFFSPRPRDLTTGVLSNHQTNALVAKIREGKSLEIDREALRSRLRNVDQIVTHMKRLPSIDWKKVDSGGQIYEKRCEPCHGPFGQPWPAAALPRGVQAAPRDLRDPGFQESMSDAELVQAFKHGRAKMPAMVPVISETEAQDLVAFLRVLSPGFETYSYYCAPCHGDDGRGHGVLASGKSHPDVVLDREYFVAKDDEALRVSVWHMLESKTSMPHFRDALDEAQAEAIIEYLRGHGSGQKERAP